MNTPTPLNRKRICVDLFITTGMTDSEARELVEQTLMNSSLNNSVFQLHINSVYVDQSVPAKQNEN